MTNLQEYKLSLFERCEAGDITKEERDLLLEAVSDDVEIDEIELEESEEISEYEESVLERFEAGLLTEEEAEMLLEATRYMKEKDKKYKDDDEKLKILIKSYVAAGNKHLNGEITDKEFNKIKKHINDMKDIYIDKKVDHSNTLDDGRKIAKLIQQNKGNDHIQINKNFAKMRKNIIKDNLNIDSSPVTQREPGHYKYEQMKRRFKSNKK